MKLSNQIKSVNKVFRQQNTKIESFSESQIIECRKTLIGEQNEKMNIDKLLGKCVFKYKNSQSPSFVQLDLLKLVNQELSEKMESQTISSNHVSRLAYDILLSMNISENPNEAQIIDYILEQKDNVYRESNINMICFNKTKDVSKLEQLIQMFIKSGENAETMVKLFKNLKFNTREQLTDFIEQYKIMDSKFTEAVKITNLAKILRVLMMSSIFVAIDNKQSRLIRMEKELTKKFDLKLKSQIDALKPYIQGEIKKLDFKGIMPDKLVELPGQINYDELEQLYKNCQGEQQESTMIKNAQEKASGTMIHSMFKDIKSVAKLSAAKKPQQNELQQNRNKITISKILTDLQISKPKKAIDQFPFFIMQGDALLVNEDKIDDVIQMFQKSKDVYSKTQQTDNKQDLDVKLTQIDQLIDAFTQLKLEDLTESKSKLEDYFDNFYQRFENLDTKYNVGRNLDQTQFNEFKAIMIRELFANDFEIEFKSSEIAIQNTHDAAFYLDYISRTLMMNHNALADLNLQNAKEKFQTYYDRNDCYLILCYLFMKSSYKLLCLIHAKKVDELMLQIKGLFDYKDNVPIHEFILGVKKEADKKFDLIYGEIHNKVKEEVTKNGLV